jgi:hypothetical protein
LVFTGVFMFCRFMCESGEPASNPPRLRNFFYRPQRHCKNCSILLGFAFGVALERKHTNCCV